MTPKTRIAVACPGTRSRRAFLRAGIAGYGSLSLANLLRLESLAATTTSGPVDRPAPGGKSMIVVWLWGGPSHMDTFDLKPDAPSEYRGQFRPVRTSVPGIEICEHLPLLAQRAHRYALVRSCHHDSPGHVNSTHSMMTGFAGELVEAPPYRPSHPDFWAVIKKTLGARTRGAPAHVALPLVRYEGAAYLGAGLESFAVPRDPNQGDFKVPNLLVDPAHNTRLGGRRELLDELDHLRRDIDQSGVMDSMDAFSQQAMAILTSDATRRAFEIRREDENLRDRYGRNVIGQRCLLARRLIEAGVRLVTVDFPCVPGQKAFSWDDHASVWNIFEQMKIRLPVLDQVVSALIDDLYERGLDRDVLLVVMGEMSHTPRLSNYNGQPGREHWSRAISLLLSGGGLGMGQVIGSTTAKGEEPLDRPIIPSDLLATWYQFLGVPLHLQFPDHNGRPVPILPQGKAIEELL